jgi:hypothetical protein
MLLKDPLLSPKKSSQWTSFLSPWVQLTICLSEILSRILVTRQETNGFQIRRSCLLDKLFTITITITQKSHIPHDATWLVCRLLVLSWAGFFSDFSSALFSLIWSPLRSPLVWPVLNSPLVWPVLSVLFGLLYATVRRPRRHLLQGFHFPCYLVY